jgi:hypothetical protein
MMRSALSLVLGIVIPSVRFLLFIIAHMTEKEKVFSKKYSQKTPLSNYTDREGGGQ